VRLSGRWLEAFEFKEGAKVTAPSASRAVCFSASLRVAFRHLTR
jgi:hypothetical protein